MWHSLVQDSSLIELCEMHITSDDNKILDLFSSKTKTELFANLKSHISDNVLQNNFGTQSNNLGMQSTADTHAVKTSLSLQFYKILPAFYLPLYYMFSFVRFSSNPQLQYAFSKILEEEADDFNLELGIDTSCLLVPELLSQLLQPVISQRPLCYKYFEIGVLHQVRSENYIVSITQHLPDGKFPLYKSKITDTETIKCGYHIVFSF
ncbi:hypothetical protein EDC94DRAFT_650585 [Helicostylum pulchrum]|nr:hypothetical protein EDC94DRAFT_650584 [Helicostylum pulchrum]KAI9255881.1 hypothetical protein EDC94DRAFT_650585 [Helicostylum pulchrum]